MEVDEQDMENTGGGIANGANGANGAGNTNGQHPTPEGSLSYREENDVSSDMEDETQDDDVQSYHNSVQDAAAQANSSLVQLMQNSSLLARFNRFEDSPELGSNRNGFDQAALQAVINSGALTHLSASPLFSPLYMSPQSQHPQNNHPQVTQSILGGAVEGPLVAPSTSRTPVPVSQPNETPPRSCRNNGESSQGNPRNNGETREVENRVSSSANNQHPSGGNWSFEEQFRQVRQLYELDENPERKEFLDNLFTFMQRRGTPINRLPIMAKSVLDLYELYKLVVIRGGLVEVINKKLWQEIIKGLRLPASITSAAFTLRTQYMKYLYPYERDRENLSTQEQLQTAIETNRRESRRNNYANFTGNNETHLVPRAPQHPMPNALQLPIVPLSGVVNDVPHGSQALLVNGHPHPHPHGSTLPMYSDYMLRMLKDGRNPMIQPQSTSTPPPSTSDAPPFTNMAEISRLLNQSLIYQHNKIYSSISSASQFSPPAVHSPLAQDGSPEPQREALDLASSGHRSDPVSSPTASRSVGSPPSGRHQEAVDLSPPPQSSRRMTLSEENGLSDGNRAQMVVTYELRGRELEVRIRYINGVTYEGILPPRNENASRSRSPSPSNTKRMRPNETP